MRKPLIAFLTFFSMSSLLWAPPQTNPSVVAVSSAPSGGCTSNEIRMVRSTGDSYACIGSTWTLLKIQQVPAAGIADVRAVHYPPGNNVPRVGGDRVVR